MKALVPALLLATLLLASCEEPAHQGPPSTAIPPGVTLGENDRLPRAISVVRPEYPLELKKRGAQGFVIVRFLINTSGEVERASVSATSDEHLGRLAVEAIRQWRFSPGVKDGHVVACFMEEPLAFSLSGSRGPSVSSIEDEIQAKVTNSIIDSLARAEDQNGNGDIASLSRPNAVLRVDLDASGRLFCSSTPRTQAETRLVAFVNDYLDRVHPSDDLVEYLHLHPGFYLHLPLF